MKVLVSAASRHGATAEIAERIGRRLGRELRDRGVEADVDVLPAEEAPDVARYDAVVLGSAVYMSRWLEPARRIVEGQAAALSGRPVWLFSSGPAGDPPRPAEEATDAAAAAEAIGAREHRTFPGKVDRGVLTMSEKMVVVALRVPDGDYRDWAGVDGWAAGIAESLRDRSDGGAGR